MSEGVDITPQAADVVRQLQQEHGELVFHLSGGCCDGSSPMCLAAGDLMIDDSDVHLGEVCGCPVYMAGFQYDRWKHTRLTIDLTPGRGSSFSLEIPLGVRFVIVSRLCGADALSTAGDPD